MDNIDEKETDELMEATLTASTEGRIKAKDLTIQLLPLLEEYFVGKFNRYGNVIVMWFANGQRFKLYVSEN